MDKNKKHPEREKVVQMPQQQAQTPQEQMMPQGEQMPMGGGGNIPANAPMQPNPNMPMQTTQPSELEIRRQNEIAMLQQEVQSRAVREGELLTEMKGMLGG